MQPGIITRIEVQKKNKNRVAVFIDEAFAFGLDINTLAKFNLKKNDTLTSERISEILLAEEKKKVQNSAFRYLANRSHSEKELKLKLKNKGFAENLIDEVLEELKAAKFIDDEQFALSFSRSRINSKQMGARLLRQELWQKGIEKEIVDKTVKLIYQDFPEEKLAASLVEKRKTKYKNLDAFEQKKKLHDFLIRRGFNWEIVQKMLEKLKPWENKIN